jgi:membrane protein DedA with SNARE-associated domain
MLILYGLSWLSVIPSPSELSTVLSRLFFTYGLSLVAVASFLENLVIVASYFPGALVIVTAMTLTSGDPHRALLTYFAIVLPAIAANISSYAVGHLTRPNQVTTARSNKALTVWYATTYWHPQLAGITAMASAVEGVSFGRYLQCFLPISLSWTIVWAVLLYHLGRVLDVTELFIPLFYLYLGVWLLWDLRKFLRHSRG